MFSLLTRGFLQVPHFLQFPCTLLFGISLPLPLSMALDQEQKWYGYCYSELLQLFPFICMCFMVYVLKADWWNDTFRKVDESMTPKCEFTCFQSSILVVMMEARISLFFLSFFFFNVCKLTGTWV